MKQKPHFRSISYLDHNEDIYSKLLTDLQNRIKAESSNPSDDTFMQPSKSTLNKQKYAEDLKRQIEEKTKSKQKERLEAHSPAFQDSRAYPNFPETPKGEKRKKLVESMRYIRSSLDEQMVFKHLEGKDSKNKEQELEKKIRDDNLSMFEREKLEKRQKRLREKEILTESWNLAVKTKDLQKKLEEINRKGASVTKERGLLKPNDTEKLEIPKSSEKEAGDLPASKTKQPKLKKPLHPNQSKNYQAKIQKIILAAKKNREDHSKNFRRHASP